MNINNPVQVTAGNIYLRPSFSHNSYLSFRHNNPSKYSFLSLSLNGNAYTNEIVYASWFDADGNRYAIPVNSQKPSLSTRLYRSFEMPLDQKRHFTFSLYANAQYSLTLSYRILPSLEYKLDDFSAQLSAGAWNRIAKPTWFRPISDVGFHKIFCTEGNDSRVIVECQNVCDAREFMNRALAYSALAILDQARNNWHYRFDKIYFVGL